MIISRFIQVAANGIISFCFLAESYSIVCVCVCVYAYIHIYICIYLYAVICQWTFRSWLLYIGVHVSFWIRVFSKYMPKSGTARSYDNSGPFLLLIFLFIVCHIFLLLLQARYYEYYFVNYWIFLSFILIKVIWKILSLWGLLSGFTG